MTLRDRRDDAALHERVCMLLVLVFASPMAAHAHGLIRSLASGHPRGVDVRLPVFGSGLHLGLDEFVRITDPPPFGMGFDNPEYRGALSAWFEEWLPDLIVFDPWNSAARDDGQRDYWSLFQALKDVLAKGDAAPALVIVAHTRKPKRDESKTGRGLLNEVAGSYVLVSVPRTVFIMQHATDDPEDDIVVWTCSKNNDGELGKRSAWHRRSGLFVPCEGFDWEAFDAPDGDKIRTVSIEDMEKLFHEGKRKLERKHAAKELEEITGLKHTACYNALSLTGRFSAQLKEDSEGLLYWQS